MIFLMPRARDWFAQTIPFGFLAAIKKGLELLFFIGFSLKECGTIWVHSLPTTSNQLLVLDIA